jgi:hypothetical protein
MEHRWNPRQPVRFDVLWHLANGVRGRAVMRDLSLEGLYLEMDSPPAVNHALELHFRLPGPDGGCFCRVEALVVHRNVAGAGLLFNGLDGRACDCVKALLCGGTTRQPLPMTEDTHSVLAA